MSKAAAASLAILSIVAEPAAGFAQAATAPLTAADRASVSRLLAADELTEVSAAPDDDSLRERALRYAVKESGLRLRPSSIQPMWALEPPRRDLAAEFAAAQAAGRLGPWLASLKPREADYARLQTAYRQYERIAASGGWTLIEAKAPLKAGTRSATVSVLRARLAAEGYGPAQAAGDPSLFDKPLADLVSAFQTTHGISADGVVGPSTRAALNVSARARLEQIEANLERLRWAPRDLPPDRVVVDTGLAEAKLVRDGVTVLTMRAVVGKPSTPTPMFRSRIETVVFNPPWNVPADIAAHEILPKAARDPGYMQREGFVRTAGGGLQQLPGPKNALGQIKFDLPSPFGVYLHDTSSRSAFARDERHLSHGCMRLEKPRELASALLGQPMESVAKQIDPGETRRAPIETPPALFVIHTTAFVDDAGVTNFRSDAYGWDHRLVTALHDQGPVRADAAPTETDCSSLQRG